MRRGARALGWPLVVMIVGWAAEPRLPKWASWNEPNPIESLASGPEPAMFHNLAHLLSMNVEQRKHLDSNCFLMLMSKPSLLFWPHQVHGISAILD